MYFNIYSGNDHSERGSAICLNVYDEEGEGAMEHRYLILTSVCSASKGEMIGQGG